MTLDQAAPPAITTVIFDYGEVISRPQSAEARSQLERLSGVAPDRFWAAYWALRPVFDTGCTPAEYWGRVAEHAEARWDARQRQRLWAADVSSWLEVRASSVELISELAGRGTRLALLSNLPRDLAGALRVSPLVEPFDTLFFSCDIGAAKPDPAVYTHVLRELGTPPERTLFVDDREDNVRSAREQGIQTHRYTGTEGLTAALTEWGLL